MHMNPVFGHIVDLMGLAWQENVLSLHNAAITATSKNAVLFIL